MANGKWQMANGNIKAVSHKLLAISSRTKRAFTLIELLVVVGIIGILSTIAAGILINVMRVHNKAQIISTLDRSGSAAVSVMCNEIRNAVSISPTSGSTATITVTRHAQDGGGSITLAFVAPGGANGYVARSGSPMTDNESETGVNITGGFTIIDPAVGPPIVRITMTVTQPVGVPARVDFQASMDFDTTVSLRSY